MIYAGFLVQRSPAQKLFLGVYYTKAIYLSHEVIRGSIVAVISGDVFQCIAILCVLWTWLQHQTHILCAIINQSGAFVHVVAVTIWAWLCGVTNVDIISWSYVPLYWILGIYISVNYPNGLGNVHNIFIPHIVYVNSSHENTRLRNTCAEESIKSSSWVAIGCYFTK